MSMKLQLSLTIILSRLAISTATFQKNCDMGYTYTIRIYNTESTQKSPRYFNIAKQHSLQWFYYQINDYLSSVYSFLQIFFPQLCLLFFFFYSRSICAVASCVAWQVGLAAWLECWLSGLGLQVWAPVMTTCESNWGISGPCKIVVQNKQNYVSFSGQISDGLSMVLVRAESHKGYGTERVRSSAAYWQSLAP